VNRTMYWQIHHASWASLDSVYSTSCQCYRYISTCPIIFYLGCLIMLAEFIVGYSGGIQERLNHPCSQQFRVRQITFMIGFNFIRFPSSLSISSRYHSRTGIRCLNRVHCNVGTAKYLFLSFLLDHGMMPIIANN